MEYSAPKQLSYSIHSCSTSTPIYHPFNILDHAPNDPNSRWSGSGPTKSPPPPSTTQQTPSIPSSTTISHPLNYPGQIAKKKDYIIIDLGKPAIVQSITFGKFHRPHPCNVKLFRIWGSLAPGEGKGDFRALLAASSSSPIRPRGPPHSTGPRMELLAQGELKNDTLPETVPLRWTNDRVAWFKSPHPSPSSIIPPLPKNNSIIIPIRYIKIEPLSATGSNYNCSIWHISVQGHDDHHLVSPCLEVYEKWRASAALRLCLKHLRQTGHLEAFQALIKSATNPLQSPLLIWPSSNSIFESPSKSENILSPTHLGPTTPEESKSTEPARFYFEHPLVSALHSALVPYLQPRSRLNDLVDSASTGPSNIRFKIPPISEAEQVVIQAALENLFDPWASAEPPTLTSQQILPLSTSSSELPGPRGGHQMCIDSKRRKIWLFGGFDGISDLGDLWVYHLEPAHLSLQQESPTPSTMMDNDLRFKDIMDSRPTLQSHDDTQTRYNRWQLISRNVKLENGPINRSCHKMVLDEMTGDLYVLGRYTERGRPVIPQASDFPRGTTNGQSPIHSGGRQMGEVSRNLQVPDTSGPSAQSEINVDEIMDDPENLPGPTSVLPSSTRRYKNDMFRFRPFKDPLSDELLNNNGRIGEWECLSQDTYAENGPELIFDHQMVLDPDRRKMYVFGGKIIQPFDSSSQESAGSSLRGNLSQYSGLFEYDLTTQTWIQLMTDAEPSATATTETQFMEVQRIIPSRMGHSLLLDKKRDCLWVLTGERDQHYYSDIWRYNFRNCQADLVDADYTHAGRHLQTSDMLKLSVAAPEAGFSQRTTFDSEADEWHMFCGLCRDRGSGEVTSKPNAKNEMMSSEFWRYSVKEGRWTKAIMKPQVDGAETPPPRFAHQMVFDDLNKTHYVFGGNPADNDNEPTRLGDFWKLKLIQPTRREALRRCLFALRRQHFIEMCAKPTDTVGALLYLQNDLSSVTNHLDEREAKLFRACTSYLLAGPGPRAPLMEEEEAHGYHLEVQYMHEGREEDYGIKLHEPYDFRNGAHSNNDDGDDFTTVENPDRYDKIRTQRTQLFQSLLKFFPTSMTEPEESLMDLIDVWGDRESLG